jgi:hypothetical protein
MATSISKSVTGGTCFRKPKYQLAPSIKVQSIFLTKIHVIGDTWCIYAMSDAGQNEVDI